MKYLVLMIVFGLLVSFSTQGQIDFEKKIEYGKVVKSVNSFAEGYLVMGCEEVNFSGTESPNISYVGANNEVKWNYPVEAFNNWNYMLNDREFAYNVNLSFKKSGKNGKIDMDHSVRITRINVEGEVTFSDLKIGNIISSFDDFKKATKVGVDYIFAKAGNVYILFSHEVGVKEDYYLCKIDKEFETTMQRIDYSTNKYGVKKSNYDKLRLIEVDSEKVYFAKVARNQVTLMVPAKFTFSIVSYSLDDLRNTVEVEPFKTVAPMAARGMQIAPCYKFYGLELLPTIDRFPNVVKKVGFGHSYHAENIDPNGYFDCERINDTWVFYGYLVDKLNDYAGVWSLQFGESVETPEMVFIPEKTIHKVGKYKPRRFLLGEDNAGEIVLVYFIEKVIDKKMKGLSIELEFENPQSAIVFNLETKTLTLVQEEMVESMIREKCFSDIGEDFSINVQRSKLKELNY